jgi:cytoskeletal protein CcmA (bactofilin family)
MRYAAILGTVTLTELAAHFLSLGWGLMFLLAAFAWTALSGATVAAKARSTESRLNAHVAATAPAVNLVANGGTIGGTVVVAGDHHITGTLFGNGGTLPVGDFVQANNGMTVNNGATVNGNFNAAGGITGSGGGTLENGSSIHTSNNLQADGQVSTSQLYVSGQRIAPGQNTPGGYPIGHGTPWEDQVIDVINAIITSTRGSGIFS